jgi:2'-5' RNA ligase
VNENKQEKKTESLRLFISLPLQPQVKEALREVQTYLPREYFKPLPMENFHLTLAFLGDTNQTNVPALEHILDEGVKGMQPFPCELSGLGAFPNPWEPRVVWVGIDVGSRESSDLSNSLRNLLRQARISFDTKPFRPHITVAYARKNLSRQELREAGEAFLQVLRQMGMETSLDHRSTGRDRLVTEGMKQPARSVVGPQLREGTEHAGQVVTVFPRVQFRMEELALVKSELRPEGALHTPLYRARFQGAKG